MTTRNTPATRDELIRSYDILVGGIEEEALDNDDRAYGGIIRAAKGKLVEQMAPHIVRLAWRDRGGNPARLSFDNVRTYRVPIQPGYVEALPEDIRDYINARIDDHTYPARVDRHVFVDGQFIMGIECKSYAENAMLKRILIDFRLLKSLNDDLICCLLQLESMLGGDYSQPLAEPQYGSPSSHTLMSFFPDIDLNIMTLLEGERHVERPIHQAAYFKEMQPDYLDAVIEQCGDLFAPFV